MKLNTKYPYIDNLAKKNNIIGLKKELENTREVIRNYSNELHGVLARQSKKVIKNENKKIKYIEEILNNKKILK